MLFLPCLNLSSTPSLPLTPRVTLGKACLLFESQFFVCEIDIMLVSQGYCNK